MTKKRTTQTKENLVQAFLKVAENKRIDKITIKEVTDTAGYYRSTFYEYFLDLQDLIDQIEDSLIKKAEKQALDSVSDITPEAFTYKCVSFYESNANLLLILLGDKGDPTFEVKLKKALRPLFNQQLGISDDNLLVEFFISGILATLTHWFRHKKDLPLEELVELISPIVRSEIVPTMKKVNHK